MALATAPSAAAHAVLEESSPSNDSVVQVSPARVALQFTESVDASPDAVRVYDEAGKSVHTTAIPQLDSRLVVVRLDSDLPDGTYTVAWRVVSDDTHPISGVFVFHVGAPGARSQGITAQVVESERIPRTVSVLFTAVRFLSYALIFLCVGGITALALVLGQATGRTRRTLLGVVAGASAALALVSLAGIVLQGATSASIGLGDAFRWPLFHEVLGTRFGEVWLARAGLALALLACALILRRAQGRVAELTLDGALLLCVGLVLTPAAAGHANGGAISFVSDVVHVQAGAVWVGGLAFLVAALLLERQRRWELASDAVPRFSNLAVISVAALLVAGVINAYLQIRSWDGLWETTYGRLVLAKVALVLPVLALGLYNNRKEVAQLGAGTASAVEKRRFLRTTVAELVLVTAVIAVTAVLVGKPPARVVTSPENPRQATPICPASSREIACSQPSTATVTGPSNGAVSLSSTSPPGTSASVER